MFEEYRQLEKNQKDYMKIMSFFASFLAMMVVGISNWLEMFLPVVAVILLSVTAITYITMTMNGQKISKNEFIDKGTRSVWIPSLLIVIVPLFVIIGISIKISGFLGLQRATIPIACIIYVALLFLMTLSAKDPENREKAGKDV